MYQPSIDLYIGRDVSNSSHQQKTSLLSFNDRSNTPFTSNCIGYNKPTSSSVRKYDAEQIGAAYVNNHLQKVGDTPQFKKNNPDYNSRKRFYGDIQTAGQQFKKTSNSSNFTPMVIAKKTPIQSSITIKSNINGTNKQNDSTEEKKSLTETKSFDLIKSLRIITGNVATVLKICKSSDLRILFEVYANVLSIRAGEHRCEKIFLLRNDTGPVMQAVFYEIDFCLLEIQTGDLVKCVGRFLEKSRLQILKIKIIDTKEMENARRLISISNFVLNKNT